MLFFVRSDWLIKLGIVSAIHLPTSFRARVFSRFQKKKGTTWLSTGLKYTETSSTQCR